MGHRGGKKGGKARGTGGFHGMDPKKQVRFETDIRTLEIVKY